MLLKLWAMSQEEASYPSNFQRIPGERRRVWAETNKSSHQPPEKPLKCGRLREGGWVCRPKQAGGWRNVLAEWASPAIVSLDCPKKSHCRRKLLEPQRILSKSSCGWAMSQEEASYPTNFQRIPGERRRVWAETNKSSHWPPVRLLKYGRLREGGWVIRPKQAGGWRNVLAEWASPVISLYCPKKSHRRRKLLEPQRILSKSSCGWAMSQQEASSPSNYQRIPGERRRVWAETNKSSHWPPVRV